MCLRGGKSNCSIKWQILWRSSFDSGKNTTQKCSMRMICQVERKKSEMFARTCDYKSETRTAEVGWDFMVYSSSGGDLNCTYFTISFWSLKNIPVKTDAVALG